MNLKIWIKVNTADKALSALREELISFFDEADSVLDIGCGSGDLLFKARSKISKGIGIDLDRDMINYAQENCKINSIGNLEFKCIDATKMEPSNFDISTCTFCLHELKQNDACEILKYMAKNSKRILIADYSKPKSFLSYLGIEFDEMISGHYLRFRKYRKAGTIFEYTKSSGLSILNTTPSSIDGITIWEIKGKI